jgi:DNA polymerase IV
MATDRLTILHVDMDAFYAAVEQRDRPELRGKPVIVGGVEGRGVVCAASYEARPFGVRSAMSIAAARRLCPQAVFLPVRMHHYAQISRQIHEIFFAYTPLVEPLSLDEAFLDTEGSEALFGPAPEIGRQIKERIQRETALTASVGVAPNKFLAKLASDHGKPDGFVVVRPEEVKGFLQPLPVGRLWGVGTKGEQALNRLGIHTIGQLAAFPEQLLIDHLGQSGRLMWQLAHGQDDRRVVPDRDAKSMSTETTFAHDIADRAVLRIWLLDLVDHLGERLRHGDVRAMTVEVKIRSSAFQTWIRSQALPEATNLTDTLWRAVAQLFERSLRPQMLPVRLLGVGASKLTRDDPVQGGLFDADEKAKQAALDRTVDSIREQLGRGAIRRASLFHRPDATSE